MGLVTRSGHDSRGQFYKLRDEVIAFSEKRSLVQDPSDLAKSVTLEAAELLEHFQWDQTWHHHAPEKDWLAIQDEVADIAWYLLTFCDRTNIDLLAALERKVEINDAKYPVEDFHQAEQADRAETYYKLKRKSRRPQPEP